MALHLTRHSPGRWYTVSLLLYCISFVLPAAFNGDRIAWGFDAFYSSVVGLAAIPFALFERAAGRGGESSFLGLLVFTVGLANPFYWISLVRWLQRGASDAFWPAIASLAFASVVIPDAHVTFHLRGPAFYLWWLSIFIVVVCAVSERLRRHGQALSR